MALATFAPMPVVQSFSPESVLRSLSAADVAAPDLRRTLGSFATGVTIVTTHSHETGQPIGLTANSFTSVSMDPPLVLWCLAKKSANLAVFMQAQAYAINILAHQQHHLCRQFSDPRVADRFAGVSWETGDSGVPVLSDCLARLECAAWDTQDAGDHIIFIGRVTNLASREGEPLVFSAGKLGNFLAGT